ncbi:hypothetical protein GCM10011578_068350 [Streptomyces fuscichromogenes]|uniref:Uncharacterized protein n=1 Tax=Streptomyces fuscichromogenes TaxID=1324013 RepID=A0A917XIZ9_9ACTN|nr:hypothetical protein GCM10011578_068350 [Streptomyces fuscichromogenes]
MKVTASRREAEARVPRDDRRRAGHQADQIIRDDVRHPHTPDQTSWHPEPLPVPADLVAAGHEHGLGQIM